MELDALLDPELVQICRELPIFSFDWASYSVDEIPKARLAFMEIIGTPEFPPPRSVIRDLSVPGAAGAPDVALRIYSPPRPGTERSCLYWIHGGGYIAGSGITFEPRLDRWSDEFDCVVVSVDYRLAPETPFPGPLEDSYAGLSWTASHAAELGIDAARIAIGGGSAGGGLCAGLALAARDRGQPIIFQLLAYPMLDDRRTTPSANMTALGWTKAANRLGWAAYLGREPGGEDVSAYAAPARATDLAGLPPAFVCVGTLDLFRDEDIDYALRLLGAGVVTELHVYPAAPHAFESFAPQSAIGARCQADMDNALRRALAH